MLYPLFFLISRLNNDCSSLVINLQINWPYLKNLSHDLDLSRSSNMVGSPYMFQYLSWRSTKTSLEADLRRGSNLLNLETGWFRTGIKKWVLIVSPLSRWSRNCMLSRKNL